MSYARRQMTLRNLFYLSIQKDNTYCRQIPKQYDQKPFLGSCLVGLLLLMSLILWGCFHTSQVTDNNELVSRSKMRPIDVDTIVAEKVGQEALENVGYDKIIKLAEKAGFVEYKADDRIQLVTYGPVVASASMRVFSRYAFAAAVTSQADSPLPGPADIAAVGIIVIGLVDAGLLDGYLLKSVGKLLVATGEATLPATVTTDVSGHPCRPCSNPRAACSRVDYVPPARSHYPCLGDHTHNYTFIMNQNPRNCECYERPQEEIVCSNHPRHLKTNPCP